MKIIIVLIALLFSNEQFSKAQISSDSLKLLYPRILNVDSAGYSNTGSYIWIDCNSSFAIVDSRSKKVLHYIDSKNRNSSWCGFSFDDNHFAIIDHFDNSISIYKLLNCELIRKIETGYRNSEAWFSLSQKSLIYQSKAHYEEWQNLVILDYEQNEILDSLVYCDTPYKTECCSMKSLHREGSNLIFNDCLTGWSSFSLHSMSLICEPNIQLNLNSSEVKSYGHIDKEMYRKNDVLEDAFYSGFLNYDTISHCVSLLDRTSNIMAALNTCNFSLQEINSMNINDKNEKYLRTIIWERWDICDSCVLFDSLNNLIQFTDIYGEEYKYEIHNTLNLASAKNALYAFRKDYLEKYWNRIFQTRDYLIFELFFSYHDFVHPAPLWDSTSTEEEVLYEGNMNLYRRVLVLRRGASNVYEHLANFRISEFGQDAILYNIDKDGNLLAFFDEADLHYMYINSEEYFQLDNMSSKLEYQLDWHVKKALLLSRGDTLISLAHQYGWDYGNTISSKLTIYDIENSEFFNVVSENNNFFQDIIPLDHTSIFAALMRNNQIKFYSHNDFSEVLTVSFFDERNYIIQLANSPYYMCSKNASKMLHYVTPSLKVIGFDQLDPVYNRPDIVLDSIGKYFGGADKELVANYRAAWEKRIERLGLDKDKLASGEITVPNAEISNADQIPYENVDGHLVIHVEANDPKYNLRRYNVLVNEVPIYGSAGISIAELNTQAWERTDTINLSIGRNKIQVSVMNELGLENFKYPTYVNYTPNNDIASKTYYVGIGVNEFKDVGHNLKYCVKDVQDLATAFAKSNSSVDTILFTNEEVTKENILSLKTYLQKNTTVNDKVIISCSSHGLLDDSLNFYLATSDVDFENPKERGLKYEELENLLDGIPARQKLLLLDACNSGDNERMFIEKNSGNDIAMNEQKRGEELEVANQEINSFQKMNELFVNVRNNTGSVIISAAGGLQNALEAIEVDGKEIENGAFTFSVLECLNSKQNLKVNDLKLYVEKRVEEITKGKQKPTSRQETMEVDWVVNK